MIKIAINGFGRIGRLFFRRAFEETEVDIVAINDLGDVENLAYLLKYDTVYGRYKKEIRFASSGSQVKLSVDGKEINFFQEKEPLKLPWSKLDVDVVVESTGFFDSYEKAKMHLEAGAKRVVITAPAQDDDGDDGQTMLMGINGENGKMTAITSNGSCTTNAASPVIQILSENPGIEKAILNTVHALTSMQTIVDSPTKGRSFRYGRAGGYNIVPSPTGAAIAVTRVVKGLAGKFDGVAMRVPLITGSIADITFVSKRKTSVEEINAILKIAAKEKCWQGIFTTTEDQIVSSDIIGEPYGAIADLNFTRVVDGNLVKVLSWYDNEWGYVTTLVEHVKKVAETVK